MQKQAHIDDFVEITPSAAVANETHGGRAKCLQRLIRLEMPVPRTVALPFHTVRSISAGRAPDLGAVLAPFDPDRLLSVRPSSGDPDWGGPSAILDIGMSRARRDRLAETLGPEAAETLYRRFILAYAVDVARLDAPIFEAEASTEDWLAIYEDEMDEPLPQDAGRQVADVLRAMAQAWEGTSARLLRQARGAPSDAGLGLVLQEMALGIGPAESGSGVIQFVSPATGEPVTTGRYRSQSQGREAVAAGGKSLYLTRDPRGPSLEELVPGVFAELEDWGRVARRQLREEMQIEFVIEAGRLSILDAVRAPRGSQADVAVAVALAEDGVIDRRTAVTRIPPAALTDLLHPRIDPDGPREVIATGLAASPGAAVGRLIFSSDAAQAAAAREEATILVKHETAPEDVRGMHAARGVLTERGGMTSHAAVIARGLGIPCIAGASGLGIDRKAGTLTSRDGRVFHEGDLITIDGTAGEALAGAARLTGPSMGGALATLLDWADDIRDLGVRANADTPAEARVAQRFRAEGIGLCRTEHMFFDADRLRLIREMIFARGPQDRAAALDLLLPMQRADFVELFRIMAGRPVCLRLFDPPLHEFLPAGREGLRDLAAGLGQPLSEVTRRVAALQEVNPMLGLRGVRLGVTMPEIYRMQARAIFEAVVEASDADGGKVMPEVMIPLVSARREVEMIRGLIEDEAAAVRRRTEHDFTYRLGAMVEVPRAALRAGEIARHCDFLSFGTNDLTQMTYGLSRDDAGRFMSHYVSSGVFPEDPFHRLDVDGVGELIELGVARGRAARPDLMVSVCGEHGGDPGSIAFCRAAGVDYVSCSPFRVPVARLAAAHITVSGGELPPE